MEIKESLQGYLIYITMAIYFLAFVTTIALQLRQMTVWMWHKSVYVLRHRPIMALEEVLSILNTLYHYANISALHAHILYCYNEICNIRFFKDPSWPKKLGSRFYILGFLLAVIAFGNRWYDVKHIPMQNMFEVFLCLGMIFPPISFFCRRILRIGVEAADMFIAVIILFPAGFVFSAELQHLPPALQSWLFAPHVAVYMLSYILMAKASVQAVGQLAKPNGPSEPELVDYEKATYRMICFGFPFLTLGLILGSYWGKYAWGDFWGWDPKELWSLVSWLVYLGYFHFRYMFGKKQAYLNSALALIGMLAIIITLLWVNLSRIFPGLHSYAT